MTRAARADMALIGVTLIWGTTFVLVKSALSDVSTFLFLTMRFSVAAFALALLYGRKVRLKKIRPAILAGLLLFLAYAFQTAGLETTTPSKSAFLTGLFVPMVPLASSLVYRVRPRAFELLGIAGATAGMILLTLPAGSFQVSRGDALSFLCAVAFALHTVVVGHYSMEIGFETLAVGQVSSAALLGALSFRLIEPVRLHPTPIVAFAVLITGLLATALAFGTQAWAQQFTTATRAVLIFALEPVIAWVTSFLLFGERLTGRAGIGAGLILLGIIVVELTASLSRNVQTNAVGSETQQS